MKTTAIIILLSLVSLNSFAQNEDVDSYNPCVTYIAKVNGLTNCHINQELFDNYDMELPLDEKPGSVPDNGRVVSLDEFRKNKK